MCIQKKKVYLFFATQDVAPQSWKLIQIPVIYLSTRREKLKTPHISIMNLPQLMLICLWYLPDLELIFCKLTPNAVWNNPLNAGLSWVLYIKYHEIRKHKQGMQYLQCCWLLSNICCGAQLCHEDTSVVQSRAALGQLREGTGACCSGCPFHRGQDARTVSHRCWLPQRRDALYVFYKTVQEVQFHIPNLPPPEAHDNEEKQTVWALRFQNDKMGVKRH